MTRLVIGSIGPASSVQDGGRPGWQRYGLTPSGAMDRLALAAANTLVGNPPFAAALEIGPLGATLTAQGGAIGIGLAGATRPAALGERALVCHQSAALRDGDSLTLGVARDGVFTYLALAGGMEGVPQFGSLSVNARAGLGSPYPRPLQAGDAIAIRPVEPPSDRVIDLPQADGSDPIRVVPGPQDDEFGEALAVFLEFEWRISAVSDRMGYRLEGPKIIHAHGHNIVSDGTVNGSIQVPGNGQPIVLMPDRGTSGGYPKIATVISADLGRLAQTPPGRPLQFRAVDIDAAQAAARAHGALLRSLPGRLRDADDRRLDLDALLAANVAGHAVSALEP